MILMERVLTWGQQYPAKYSVLSRPEPQISPGPIIAGVEKWGSVYKQEGLWLRHKKELPEG